MSHETVRKIVDRKLGRGKNRAKKGTGSPAGDQAAIVPTGGPEDIARAMKTLRSKEAEEEWQRIDRVSRRAILGGLGTLLRIADVERTRAKNTSSPKMKRESERTQAWIAKVLIDAGNALQGGRRREETHAMQILVDARQSASVQTPEAAAMDAAAAMVADKVLNIVCPKCLKKIADVDFAMDSDVIDVEVIRG